MSYGSPFSDNLGVATWSCSPASGQTFPVGTTTVTCSGSDAAGNATNGSFDVTVTPLPPGPTAAEQVDDLRDAVASMSMPRSVRIALNAALDRIGRAVAADRPDSACRGLVAFVTTVNVASSLRRLSHADADALRSSARTLRGTIGC